MKWKEEDLRADQEADVYQSCKTDNNVKSRMEEYGRGEYMEGQSFMEETFK